MAMTRPIKVVIDTNVLMEGLTKQGSAADLVIDCAMNAGAIVVTSNLKDFRSAEQSLGLIVMSSVQLVLELAAGGYP
jgi:predicted nucleic acid-binding protein